MNAQRKRPGSPRGEAGRRLLVGVQWDAACWTRAPLLVDRILRLLHGVPLHWNLPAFPSDEADPSPLAEVLRERLASAGDSLIAMGCTGACQPVLGLAELDREVAWGLRNPWSTGIVDVLGKRPSAIAPRLADLDRPGAAALFLRRGLALVGTAAAHRPLSFAGHYGVRVFPFTRLPLAGAGRASLDADLRRLLAIAGDVFLMIDLGALPAAPAAASPLIESFAERVLGSGRTVVTLADAALGGELRQPAGGRATAETAEWRNFPAALVRRRLEAAESLRRRKRKPTDETRELLALLSAATREPEAPTSIAPKRHADRGLIAHMQGETTLSGETFDVRFAGGRFCGLVRGRESLTPARPAVSLLRVDGRTLAARGRSAFSFEGDDGTGLREDLAIEPGGSVVVDYAFRGDHPFLAVEASFTFPTLPPEAVVEEWTPFAFALAEASPGREASVAFETPDGSTGTCLVAEGDGWRPAAGSIFRVKAGAAEIELTSGSGGIPAWGVFLFRIARAGPGRRVLEVSPFGTAGPVPAAALAGTSATRGFTIGLGRQ